MEKGLCDYALSSDDESENNSVSHEVQQAGSSSLKRPDGDLSKKDEQLEEEDRDECDVLRDQLFEDIRRRAQQRDGHDDVPSTSTRKRQPQPLPQDADAVEEQEEEGKRQDDNVEAEKRQERDIEEADSSRRHFAPALAEGDRSPPDQYSSRYHRRDSRRRRSRSAEKTSGGNRDGHGSSSYSDRDQGDRQKHRGYHHHARYRGREYDRDRDYHHSRYGRSHQQEVDRVERVRKETGIALPEYYNPSRIDPEKYAEQTKKRKLLWRGNDEKVSSSWQQVIAACSDDKQAEKLKKLIGLKQSSQTDDSEANSCSHGVSSSQKSGMQQAELFHNLDQQYELARRTTHTHRGMGLGFS